MKPLRCIFKKHFYEIRSIELPFNMWLRKTDEEHYNGLVKWQDDREYQPCENNTRYDDGYGYATAIKNIFINTSFEIDSEKEVITIHFHKCIYCGKRISMTDMEYAESKTDRSLLVTEGLI